MWPHQVLEEATPFDLRVWHTAIEFEAAQREWHDNNKGQGQDNRVLTIEDVKAAVGGGE